MERRRAGVGGAAASASRDARGGGERRPVRRRHRREARRLDRALDRRRRRRSRRRSAAAPLRANPAARLRAHGAGPAAEGADRRAPGPTRRSASARTASYVVYGDVGANQTPDVYAVTLDRELKPRLARAGQPGRDEEDAAVPAGGGARPDDRRRSGRAGTTRPSTANAHRAWFTCSASHERAHAGRAPLRAAAEPTSPNILYGTLGGTGLYAAVAARQGVAHVVLGRRPRDRELGRHLHGRDPREDRVLTRELTFLTLRG